MEFVYSVEPLRSIYDLSNLGNWISFTAYVVFSTAVLVGMAALFGAKRSLMAVIGICSVAPQLTLFLVQGFSYTPPPNTVVTGSLVDARSVQELVRVSKHVREPRIQGYMIYLVDDVYYPVRVSPGSVYPTKAIFYKNPISYKGK